MRRRFSQTLAAAALLLAAAPLGGWLGCARPAPQGVPPIEVPVAREPEAPGVCTRVVRLAVRKAERSLTAECAEGGNLVIPIALARARGPKRAEGDLRMPEGDYRIAGRPRRSSRFHLFIPIDYPSRADADRALAEGRIDRAVHATIVAAHRNGRLPPQTTPLGGHLGLHGEGPRWRGDLDLDWTEGCIAVADRDIERLARLVRPGTPIRIDP